MIQKSGIRKSHQAVKTRLSQSAAFLKRMKSGTRSAMPPDKKVLPDGEYANPVERFNQLPEPTRKWLEDLREDDIKQLNDLVRILNSSRILGGALKWVLLTMLAALMFGIQFGEAIARYWGLIKGGGPK